MTCTLPGSRVCTRKGGASTLLPGCGGEDDLYASTAYDLGWIKAVERGEDPVAAEPRRHHGPGPQAVTPAAVQHRAAAVQQWKKNYALAG